MLKRESYLPGAAHLPVINEVTRISYTVAAACKASGLGRSTLYTLMAEGRLTKVKVNGRTLITAASLIALINGGK